MHVQVPQRVAVLITSLLFTLLALSSSGCAGLAAHSESSSPAQPMSFHATLTFSPPMSVSDFTKFVHDTGVMPTQNSLEGTGEDGRTGYMGAPGVWAHDASGRELTGTPQPGSDGIDVEHLAMFISPRKLEDVRVVRSEVILDNGIYSRLKGDARVLVDTGGVGGGAPIESSQEIVGRWKDAAAKVQTARGHVDYSILRPDGTRIPVSKPEDGMPISTDEAYDFGDSPNQVVRFK